MIARCYFVFGVVVKAENLIAHSVAVTLEITLTSRLYLRRVGEMKRFIITNILTKEKKGQAKSENYWVRSYCDIRASILMPISLITSKQLKHWS